MQQKFGARVALIVVAMVAAPLVPGTLGAQTPPARDSTRPPRDSTRMPDSTRRVVVPKPPPGAGVLDSVPGGEQLPFHLSIRSEARADRHKNLRCSSGDLAQISAISGCSTNFIFTPSTGAKWSLKMTGTVADRIHVNVDFDGEREFEASNILSLQYEGKQGEKLQRVDIGNIAFSAPPSRFITSSAPSGNLGVQVVSQFGNLKLKTIFAQQTGNVVQSRQYTIAARTEQHTVRQIDDYQIERLRFFFTIDPALLGGGRAYPNIDILNRTQLTALYNALPDTLRPTRVFLYRLQFGAQPQNANGPQLRIQGDPGRGRQTYDLLREGVDYVMDPSNLWFALVRPLNEANERLLVAFNVRINGRDTVWTTTGGTPDIQAAPSRDQVANLVMDPTVGPSSPAFRREIRSVYRVAGEDLVRFKTRVRIVTGGGLLERPLAGQNATFLQMFGLAQPTNPAEFDYNNRLWPRASDPIFNLGAGAADVRNGQSLDPSRVLRDYFLVFPSVQPFSPRVGTGGGLVDPGNPSNDAIYTIAGEYLYSPQHPASLYRIHLEYESAGTDDAGAITLGATQMRPGSDRVTVDGRPVIRDLDYTIDYDLGRIEFTRSDTLLRQQRRVEVRYEENPAFVPTPTTLAGFVSELPVKNGVLNFSAINQSQSTVAYRPQLGFQGSSSLTTGVSGQFNWNAPALTNLVNRLPFRQTTTPSRISLQAEVATSHPQFLARNQGTAWAEEFEGTGGYNIPLSDVLWQYSSLPAYGTVLRNSYGGGFFEANRAATLVWQTNGRRAGGGSAVFTQSQIDPLTSLFGTGREPNEQVLWLTLLPLSQAGRYQPDARRFDWTVNNAPRGQRFRSMRATLSPSGLDLSRGEFLELWALVDTAALRRSANPTLIFDFGDVSENSLTFAPDTLRIVRNTNGTVDSVFTGRRRQGFDRLDSERDPYSHAFNFEVNDKGLPGDVADTLIVIDGSTVRREVNVAVCRYALGTIEFLGNPRANCTVDNSRLDEEDIDLDNALNLSGAQREGERVLRYVVDLTDRARYRRVGGSFTDTLIVGGGAPRVRTRQWVLVSIPFNSPHDSIGDVNRRRVRSVRLTVVSGVGLDDNEALQFPIAGLRVTGAPWINRANTSLAGVAGLRPGGGFVITSSIGTNDSSAALVYQPPPGVGDQPEFRGTGAGLTPTQINEHSMRIQAAGNVPLYHRTESYLRFPAGSQNYLVSKRLRVWGRGRGHGWGTNGELQMFVKVGRDENNFYLYRAPLEAGSTQAAWTDLRIDFSRFRTLRQQIEADFLAGRPGSNTCTGIDSAIVAASPIPPGVAPTRFVACDNGYMVYTLDPAVTAPNLASVQELAAGIIRVAQGGGAEPILPGDTLELWVDDMRLEEPENTMGVAGQISLQLNAADLGDLRLTFSNKDPNFRQVGEAPTFLGERNLDIMGTLHLEKMLPSSWGIALPLTINKLSLSNDPLYLSRTDIPGRGLAGLRKPKTDLTTVSVSLRRTTPVEGAGVVGPLLNNLALTSSYTTGVNRTEYQDGKARNLSVSLDYVVSSDDAQTVPLPSWLGALGALRWNPTHLRLTSGIIRASDRRVSFLKPAGALDDRPTTSEALNRLWRTGSTLELRPTTSLTARWEAQSVRDLRMYGDTSMLAAAASHAGRTWLGANAGFERERNLITTVSWTPALATWLMPRAELGTQYNMLRDPNSRSLVPLPGVIIVDSILAARDSIAMLSSLTLARRMTAAQTASVGTQIDLSRAIAAMSSDSTSTMNRLGRVFAPLDVSYTRSLLASLDAAPVSAPLSLQLGLGGPSAFRTVNGVPATTSGETGSFNAAGTLQLPFGTSFVNRFSRTTTANWIARPDGTQAQVDGAQRQFPDVALQWSYRPATPTTFVTNFNASAGYVRTNASVTLPSFAFESAPELRHSIVQSFPLAGSVVWGGMGGLSTSARYSLRRSVDSLAGSVARSRGTDMAFDASRTFRRPAQWLGIRDDLRTRFSYQQSHNTTSILDGVGVVRARLQDNGREAFTFTADSRLNAFVLFTANGSHIVTFDNNLNRRFAYTVFSAAFQVQFYGVGK